MGNCIYHIIRHFVKIPKQTVCAERYILNNVLSDSPLRENAKQVTRFVKMQNQQYTIWHFNV